MASRKEEKRVPMRDQQRALHAYQSVDGVPALQRGEYATAVHDLGANLLRSGLCAALAAIQRLGARGAPLLQHLATADVPGLAGATPKDLARRARELDAHAYIIATREMIHVAVWLKRAVQATTTEGP